MGLSSDLISQFIKATNDEKKTESEATLYGTTVEYNGSIYVQLDGSELLTPVSKTADAKPDERVTVRIKNHTATITGNASSPSARTDDVKDLGDKVTEVDNLVADSVTAIDGRFENLSAEYAKIEYLEAEYAKIDDLEATNATIKNLDAKYATIEKLEATNATIKNLDAKYATIEKLEADYASITYLEANYATIDDLKSINIDTESLSANFANIDFANIGEAAIENFYAKSGIIETVTSADGTFTRNLVAVNIKGDLIEGGTIIADKLVIQGDDGLYYKLNFEGGNFTDAEEVPRDSLHGSIITAQSVTADKVSVTDLVAFGATIGGFHITDNALYSGVKESVENTTRGTYLDADGQFAVGDNNNYIKFYRLSDGNYKLDIAADSLTFGSTKTSVETVTAEAKASAEAASGVAAEAQRVAEEVGEQAAIALESANTAMGWADEAKTSAYDAAKTATNYLTMANAGLIVGNMTADVLGKNVLISTNGVDIRDGDKVLASYGSNTIHLGKDSERTTIYMCGSGVRMQAFDSDYGVGYTLSTQHQLNLYADGNVYISSYYDSSLGWDTESWFRVESHSVGSDNKPYSNSNVEFYSRSFDIGLNTNTLSRFSMSSSRLSILVGDTYDNDPFAHIYTVKNEVPSDNPSVSGQMYTRTSMDLHLETIGGVYIESDGTGIHLTGPVYPSEHIILANGNALQGLSTSGETRSLIYINTSNNIQVGYGGYSAGEGQTSLYGNRVVLAVKTAGVAFRPYYEAGDSISFIWSGAGFISSSSKKIYFSIPVSKPIIGNPTVKIADVDGLQIRQGGSYCYDSTSSTYAKASSYSAEVGGNGSFIRIIATMSNTTNVTNNEVCGIYASIKATFS